MELHQVLLSLAQIIYLASALQCYSGSQVQVMDCPAASCIKQTLGTDTVRYCDGVNIASVCQTYRIVETCDNIPNLGFICCCSANLCNTSSNYLLIFPVLLLTLLRMLL